MLGLWIKNSLNTDDKRKLRAFGYLYTLHNQYDGAVVFFVMVKMVRPDIRAGCSDTKKNLETMKMSQCKNDTPKSNL